MQSPVSHMSELDWNLIVYAYSCIFHTSIFVIFRDKAEYRMRMSLRQNRSCHSEAKHSQFLLSRTLLRKNCPRSRSIENRPTSILAKNLCIAERFCAKYQYPKRTKMISTSDWVNRIGTKQNCSTKTWSDLILVRRKNQRCSPRIDFQLRNKWDCIKCGKKRMICVFILKSHPVVELVRLRLVSAMKSVSVLFESVLKLSFYQWINIFELKVLKDSSFSCKWRLVAKQTQRKFVHVFVI